jgi:LPXTG-motif cell wall-anchored protein
MRLLRSFLVALTLTLLVAMFLVPAQADQWNKKTVVTFSQPIEIPGGKTLSAGTYTFKLLDTLSYRHIVQIWNEDGTQLFTTILAIPNYRLEPTGETVINFHERPGVCPVALRAWFYPGDSFGHEFVYPKERAMELAEKCREIVPAETVKPTESNLKTVPLEAITPEKKEEPVAEAIQVLPLHPEKTAIPAKELPKTGSLTPLFGLLGLVSIGLAFALKLVAKQLS